MRTDVAPQPIRRADYQPFPFAIETVSLEVSLDPARTHISSTLKVKRKGDAEKTAPLILNGEAIELRSVKINGEPVPSDAYELDDKHLTINTDLSDFTLAIENTCGPEANTALSGLYLSNGMFCTQCEAEGFRRITFYPDRPDVLSVFTVRVEGDLETSPVLLSNGNSLEAGELEGGRHFAVWNDPHPKPAYLFALVGGDLACVEDTFATRSGREVTLRVFVQHQNKDKCGYTLDALKRSMRWDEEVFGREYDLDIFMIVAVDHFNFGAMENKGLNVFNSAYVLASPETATDKDYETIEAIVAHEYFHNWSGNRVTCRDWFQLCLKEGFTVFRDQEFSADMRSRAVQRIKDVRRLWSMQFPEDAGPLAHPPRPDEYITIDNFYTATVYEKGAEVVRMLKTLLGPEKFRAASDLYFERHDGEAATVEDFVTAMEDASGQDLSQFRRWYSDAGTPVIRAEIDDATAIIKLTQETQPTPGQPEKQARAIPVAYAAFDADSGDKLDEGLAVMTGATHEIPLPGLRGAEKKPLVSLMRGFSAPVRLEQNLTIDDRLALMRIDDDPFNRWANANRIWRALCAAHAGARPDFGSAFDKDQISAAFADALADAINSAADPALASELLSPPSGAELMQEGNSLDPVAIANGRKTLLAAISTQMSEALVDAYEKNKEHSPYRPDADQAGPRALKNAALYLITAGGDAQMAALQAQNASNMTDEAAALAALAQSDTPEREAALDRFYEKWKSDPLVVNKWLAWRAMAPGQNALDEITALQTHPAFDPGNPNKVRALIAVFARENIAAFHAADGAGYDFFKAAIVDIDKRNPQLAARLVGLLESWRSLEPQRQTKVQSALNEIKQRKDLSKNLFEMVDRLLKP
ncbi:MAG: aminopeptidase N [Pseudomonadota bacterium]